MLAYRCSTGRRLGCSVGFTLVPHYPKSCQYTSGSGTPVFFVRAKFLGLLANTKRVGAGVLVS